MTDDKDTRGSEAALDDAEQIDHEAAEGGRVPGRDGGPVDPEAMQAAEGLQTSDTAAKNYEDMLERGAQQKGEGRLP